jgi:hypothetical protein
VSAEDREPLVDGLGPGPVRFDVPSPPAALRAALLERTAGAVRSRARWRRVRFAAALLLVYAAGLATLAPFLRERAHEPRAGTQAPAPRDVALAPPGPEEMLRRVPAAPPQDRARLLQLAGDRFLAERGDPGAALECYRQAFEIAPLAGAEPQDSWLLISLKQARRSQEGVLR